MIENVVCVIIFKTFLRWLHNTGQNTNMFSFSWVLCNLNVGQKDTKVGYKFNKPMSNFSLFLEMFFYIAQFSYLHTHRDEHVVLGCLCFFFWFSFFLLHSLLHTRSPTLRVPHNAQWNSATPEITIEKSGWDLLLVCFLFIRIFFRIN